MLCIGKCIGPKVGIVVDWLCEDLSIKLHFGITQKVKFFGVGFAPLSKEGMCLHTTLYTLPP